MTKPTDSDDRTRKADIRALCCECGTLRTWSRKAGLRNHLWRTWSAEEIADYEKRWAQTWANPQPHHRQLADMRCATCKSVRRHALITSDHIAPEIRNADEVEDRSLANKPETGKAEFEKDKQRLERFGIEFEYRDDTALMLNGGIHYYDIEQYDDDQCFLVRLNPNLPWPLLTKALDAAWWTISDHDRCERRGWAKREDHRSLYYTVDPDTIDDYVRREVADADRWGRVWALREPG